MNDPRRIPRDEIDRAIRRAAERDEREARIPPEVWVIAGICAAAWVSAAVAWFG